MKTTIKSIITAAIVCAVGLGVLPTTAEEVSRTFADMGLENGTTPGIIDLGDVEISFDKGSGDAPPKYYEPATATSHIRCYAGNTFTVSATNESTKLTSITLTFGSSDGSNAISTSNGNYEGGIWQATTDTSSVKFSIGGTGGNRRLAGITVAYTTAAEPVEYLDWDEVEKKMTNATCQVGEYTVVTADMAAFDAGKTYVVKGVVTNETGGITVEGTEAEPTRLILCDEAKLVVISGDEKAGIVVAADGAMTNALVICGQTEGSGALEATGSDDEMGGGAGIGGSYEGAGGNVTINGGEVMATGGVGGAGIGGGYEGAGGNVTINGGEVTATGGEEGAGIGGGEWGAGGTVTINGGTVTATGGDYATGIGAGGNGGAGGTVTINGGKVTATGCEYAAGIGGGDGGAGGNVTINGGTVTATGGVGGAGIGGGLSAEDQGTVTFGAGFAGGVLAGADAAGAVYMTTTAYTNDHSAAYVTMPVVTLKIPAAGAGYSYVVSNETAGVELAASLADGTNTYAVLTGNTVKVYFTLAKGYKWDGDFDNPMDLGAIKADRVIDEAQMPTAMKIPVPYLDWDDEKKEMTGAVCMVYETYTGQTTLDAGKTYVVMGDVTNTTGITVNGTAESPTRLILCDGAKLTAQKGIIVASDNALVICAQSEGDSAGALTATGDGTAGIGGGNGGAGGTVTINGGVVTATGGGNAAGIGGGWGGNGGSVTVNGGTVTANSGMSAAGIGGGNGGAGGTVTINGGMVMATGGNMAAGIGGGLNGAGGTVTINGGTVTATGGMGGAGIGGNSNAGTVTFGEGVWIVKQGASAPGTDTTVEAYVSDHSAKYVHIELAPPVEYLDWDDVGKKMTNAVCTVYTEYTGQAMLKEGTTYVVKGDVTNTTRITVNGTAASPTRLILCDGAKLTAQKCIGVGASGATTNALIICAQSEGDSAGALEATGSNMAAGIGGGYNGMGGIVTINGGSVTAAGDSNGAGIGGGGLGNGGTVTINGGIVTATGGSSATGIGGGLNGTGGTVAINGGSVTASGGIGGAGIGGKSNAGTVTFGASFSVVTGKTAAVTAPIAQEDYEADHSAMYVHIEPAPVALGEVASHEPWDGKFDVEYTLKGLAADVDYKIAFDITADGKSTSVTNDAAKLANGTYTNTLDTATLFGEITKDKTATVKISLIKVNPPPAGQLWAGGPIFAECNVGATKPEEYGILKEFGDTAQAVTDAMGAGWSVPSEEDLKKLAGKNEGSVVCSNVWTTCGGVAGRRFFGMTSGYEDRSIFLPAAGYYYGSDRMKAETNGYYWTSTGEGAGGYAWGFIFDAGFAYMGSSSRSYGMSVRAVRGSAASGVSEEVVATDEKTFLLGPAAPEGSEGNPWKVGVPTAADVIAYTNGTGKLVIEGVGAMMNFSQEGGSAPWSGSSVTSAEIGAGVTNIGNNAFMNCSEMTNLTLKATRPPTLGESAIPDNVMAITVPQWSSGTYKHADGWSDLAAKIVEPPAPEMWVDGHVIGSNQVGVCSWTWHADMTNVLRQMKQDGRYKGVQLALAPWLGIDESTLYFGTPEGREMWDFITNKVSTGELDVMATMINFPGEDYTTLISITNTQGYMYGVREGWSDADERWASNLYYTAEAARLTRELGIDTLTTESGFICIDENLMFEHMTELCRVCGSYGVQLLIESGPQNSVYMTNLLARLNNEGYTNVGVNFDPGDTRLFHPEDPADSYEIMKPWIRMVHVKDCKADDKRTAWNEDCVWGDGIVSTMNFNREPGGEKHRFIPQLKAEGYVGDILYERLSGDETLTEGRAAEITKAIDRIFADIEGKALGSEEFPFCAGDGVEAYTNGTELVIFGEGTVDVLDETIFNVIDRTKLSAITITEATVTGVASDAFQGINGIALTLPDGWQGDFPDEGGNWYGAANVSLSAYPLTVRNVTSAQHWPWTDKIDVTCDLTGKGSIELAIALFTNDVKVCDADAANITGATVINLDDEVGEATNGVRLVWDAKQDIADAAFLSDQAKVVVVMKKVAAPLPSVKAAKDALTTTKFGKGGVISAESEAFAYDVRAAIALAEGDVAVSGVSYSDTAWGAAAKADVTLGYANETTGAVGTLATGLSGAGAVDVNLPKKDGVYKLTHSTGALTSFVTFTVSGYPTVKIPAGAHYTYVVSNETEEITGELLDGTNNYAVAKGTKVKVYFTPDENYEWDGAFANPKEIGPIESDTVIYASEMPKAVTVFVAEVMVGGETHQYKDFNEAWRDAHLLSSETPATLKLLRNINLTNTMETVTQPE